MRVSVVGSSGSGKSTVARRLAETLGVRYVELDALHWRPGWVEEEHDGLGRSSSLGSERLGHPLGVGLVCSAGEAL
ncbi:shikimate kinase [Nocardioides sp. NPDC127514]|uniref:AAA family ATPase n=1 Tax=unclassified Nocardioides TaxID=2615069 RepID=UPI00332A3645